MNLNWLSTSYISSPVNIKVLQLYIHYLQYNTIIYFLVNRLRVFCLSIIVLNKINSAVKLFLPVDVCIHVFTTRMLFLLFFRSIMTPSIRINGNRAIMTGFNLPQLSFTYLDFDVVILNVFIVLFFINNLLSENSEMSDDVKYSKRLC